MGEPHNEATKVEDTIKIVDKRRFTSAGEIKREALNRPDPQKPPPPPPKEAPSGDKDAAAPQPRQDGFLPFISQLAQTALAAMGLLPELGAVPQDLGMARQYIEIIGMLKERAKGNLSREEDAAITRILTELRLEYVRRTQPQPGPGGAPAPFGA